MNFVFISPHFPVNMFNLCVALRKKGVNVLGIADVDYDELCPELKESLTDYYQVEDMHDREQMLKACGYFTFKHGKIDRIESNNEYWLETDAFLRTAFNVPGVKSEELIDCIQKMRMKKKFIEAGVPVARGILVTDREAAEQFIQEVGFPVVAKPDRGMGAAGTFKISTYEDLSGFFAVKPDTEYIMEEFIAGDIYTLDGLVDRDGKLVFSMSSVYGEGVMESVHSDNHIFYYTLRDLPHELEKLARKTLKAFNVRERFFHFEYFLTKDSQLIAIEVNMRAPGGFTLDMWNYACDLDIYAQWANVVVDNKFTVDYERKYHVAHIGRKFGRPYSHAHEQIMAAYGDCVVRHEALSPVLARAMGDYVYLVRTPIRDKLLEIVRYVLWMS